MTQQINGQVYLNPNYYDTYDHWRAFCLTHGINFDWVYGNQCVDTPKLLWFQYGLRYYTGSQGYAYESWTQNQTNNARYPFIAVEGVANIKRGDCIIFGANSWSAYGHVGFADEDFQVGKATIKCLGQNQGQGISSGTPSNIIEMNLSRYLGSFRNTKWTTTPPTPPTPPSGATRKGEFPWVLYSRKLRKIR